MPEITPEENALLVSLTAPNVLTLGKARMKEVSALIHRLMFLADKADNDTRNAKLMSNGFWLVASGELDETAIANHPLLTDQQRDDLLTMLQLRYYAAAWCEQEGIGVEAMPEVEKLPVQGPEVPVPTDAEMLPILE